MRLMENKMARYTFLDFAYDILKEAKSPMSYSEIWKKGVELGLDKKLRSVGKTPMISLSAILGSNASGDDPQYCVVSNRPKTFWLKSRESELSVKEIVDEVEKQEEKQEKERERKRDFHERDLHPLLVKFMHMTNDSKFFCKTIFHEVSKKGKSGTHQWIHPDIVGIYYPFIFKKQTSDFLKNLGKTPYKLYSFELKVSLNFLNLRECYFQTVSNSSWANEGYLVVLECDESKDFMDELWRLNNAFGIGVIRLNAEDLLASEVLIPAKERENLDFETINLLVGKNQNFKEFIESINQNIELANSKYDYNIVKTSYDKVYSDEEMEKHIKDKKII